MSEQTTVRTSGYGYDVAEAPTRLAGLDSLPWVRHAITVRDALMPVGGDMSLATGRDDPDGVIANRRRWLGTLGQSLGDGVMSGLVHGTAVEAVTRADCGRGIRSAATTIAKTDGLITHEPGVTLMMCFADCVPIIVVDTERRRIGLAHAGWRGTLAGMAGSLISAMVTAYGSDPSEMVAVIGPSIGPEAYTVGPDVSESFRAAYPDDAVIRCEADQTRLNLWRANACQLRRAGIPAERVHISGRCTFALGDTYFSHRHARATGEREGRFAVLLTMEA